MPADRYMKIVLTVIALELGWIAVKDTAVEVSAQQQATAMPVIIRGVEATPGKPGSIPVTITGSTTTVRVASERPFQVDVPQPLRIQADQPIVVETGQRPLLIQSVPGAPAPRPGI
jgi:hypothetical protein